jgi:signal transduction histidine kinase
MKIGRYIKSLLKLTTMSKNNIEFNKDLVDMYNYLQSAAEEGDFFELKADFIVSAFSELIGSAWFTTLSEDRRKKMFENYTILSLLLNKLADFFNEYPDKKITDVLIHA